MTKDLTSEKEEIKWSITMKKYTRWLTLMMWYKKT